MRSWITAIAATVLVIGVVIAVLFVVRGQRSAADVVRTPVTKPAATGVSSTASAPVAQGAALASPAPVSRLKTYTSPRYGYSLTYDTEIWDGMGYQNTATVNGYLHEIDVLQLEHRTLPVQLRIEGEAGTIGGSNWMPNCVEDKLYVIQMFDSEESPATPVVDGGDGRAWTQVEFPANDGSGRRVVYAQCLWIGGGITLTIEHNGPVADYPASIEARDALLATLDTTGVEGEAATPMASPVTPTMATPVATPVGDR